MHSIAKNTTIQPLSEEYIARDEHGRIVGRAAMVYDPEQGFIQFAPPENSQEAQHPTDEDDSLGANERYQALLKDVYVAALAALPDTGERLEKALDLVQGGHITLGREPHTYRVKGLTSGTLRTVGFQTCTCEDFARAPGNWCKHRLAVALYRRSLQRFYHTDNPSLDAPEPVMLVPAPPAPLHPDLEAAIIERHSFDARGTRAIRYAGLLLLAKQRGLASIQASWTYNDAGLSLATATATFADGSHYTDCGDATPENVTALVKPHFRRMALTRAKARALRDALGIDMVSFEELGEGA
jgi:hypothetical protein